MMMKLKQRSTTNDPRRHSYNSSNNNNNNNLLWIRTTLHVSAFLLLLNISVIQGQPQQDCASQNGCVDCVGANCAWAIGICFNSCNDIAPGVDCFELEPNNSTTTTTTTNTAESVCDIQAGQAIDVATCGTQDSCPACTSTELVSSSGNCSWYQDTQTCSHLECDEDGCASPYCPETPEGACFFQGASDCLTCLSLNCTWVEDRCELNCNPEDSATFCYNPDNFPTQGNSSSNSTLEQICEVADNLAMDMELCQSQEDCESCTDAIKSDGSPCEWYFDEETFTGTCGLGGCDDDTGLCPVETCEGLPEAPADLLCSAFEEDSDVEPTCQTCLENQCSWTTGTRCLGSCRFSGDVPCYSFANATATTSTNRQPSSSSSSIQEICQRASTERVDQQLCQRKESCRDCVSTFKSDRQSTCEWYIDEDTEREWCGTGITTINGVEGSRTCPNPCQYLDRCAPCVASALNCAWFASDESCNAVSACDNDQDEDCYAKVEFPDLTPTQICRQASGEPATDNGGGTGSDSSGNDGDGGDGDGNEGDGDGDSEGGDGGGGGDRDIDESSAFTSSLCATRVAYYVAAALLVAGHYML